MARFSGRVTSPKVTIGVVGLLRPNTPARDEEMADFLVYHPRPPRQRRVRIFRTDRGYRVRGEASEEDLRAAGVKADAVVEFEDE